MKILIKETPESNGMTFTLTGEGLRLMDLPSTPRYCHVQAGEGFGFQMPYGATIEVLDDRCESPDAQTTPRERIAHKAAAPYDTGGEF